MQKISLRCEGCEEFWNTLGEHGYEAYAVGGCVRDSLLGTDAAGLGHHDLGETGAGKELFSGTRLIPGSSMGR